MRELITRILRNIAPATIMIYLSRIERVLWLLVGISALVYVPAEAYEKQKTPVLAHTLKIGGTGGAMGAMKELAAAFNKVHRDVKIVFIPHLGTRGGIAAVKDGALDIGLAARELTPAERSAGLKDVEYAKSALVFAISGKSAVTSITTEQVAKIYRGEMKTWSDGTPVRLVMRPCGHGDIIHLKKISPALQRAVEYAESREGLLTALTDQDCADAVEQIRGAFGVLPLTQIVSEKRELRALVLDGVMPGAKTVEDGRYPHFKTFHMVTGPKAPPAALRFIEFVTSKAGRAILGRTGNSVQR